MLKLKLQFYGHLMQRTDSLEKTLMLGKIKGGKTVARHAARHPVPSGDGGVWGETGGSSRLLPAAT